MKRLSFILAPLLILTLTGCTSNSAKKESFSSHLESTRLNLDTNTSNSTNSKGVAFVSGRTNPNAKVSYDYKFGNSTKRGKLTATKQGTFKFQVKLSSTQKEEPVNVYAKLANHKQGYDAIMIENNGAAYEKKQEESSKEVSIQESKEIASDSAKESSKAVAKNATATSSSHSSKYPNIDSVFNTDKMMSYSDNDLFGKAVKLSGTITSLGADGTKQYHILLTGNSSSQKYLIVVSSSKTGKLTEHSNATVYGTITGKSHVNDNQINSGISENYYKDPIILVDADKVS